MQSITALQTQEDPSPKSRSLRIHEEALVRAKNYKHAQSELLKIIIEAAKYRIYAEFDISSLHEYCVALLDLPPQTASDFINVINKSAEVPEILEPIFSGRTTVSKIRKIVSVVTKENSREWIDLVQSCSTRIVEKAVAMKNPRAAVPESLKYVSGNILELRLAVSDEWAELLKKTKDRLSQKLKRNVSTEEALFHVMQEAHQKHDPVHKAERAKARAVKRKTLRTAPSVREHLNAAITKKNRRSRYRPVDIQHEVTIRDANQCVHLDANGDRCANKRWLEQHHVIEFSKGGSHTPENLVTLCGFHHRLRHAH